MLRNTLLAALAAEESDTPAQLWRELHDALEAWAATHGNPWASVELRKLAEQQVTGIEQIAAAMGSIHQVSTQSVVGAQQTERAAADLAELARKLREAVEQYRL